MDGVRCRKAMLGVWGDRYVLGFESALCFLRSEILCRFYKSPSDKPRSPVCIRMQKDHIRTLKIL